MHQTSKKDYWDCNFVIAHLDKHISIGAHRKGLMIDVTYPLTKDLSAFIQQEIYL